MAIVKKGTLDFIVVGLFLNYDKVDNTLVISWMLQKMAQKVWGPCW